MSLNSVGRPTRPAADAPAAGFASLSGGRGLLQDEALIFERDSWEGTGVDLPSPDAGAEDLAGLVRARPLSLGPTTITPSWSLAGWTCTIGSSPKAAAAVFASLSTSQGSRK